MTKYICDLYKDYKYRLVSPSEILRLAEKGKPACLFRLHTPSMAIADHYEFPCGYMTLSSLFCYFGESKIREDTQLAIAKGRGEARKLFMKLINLRKPCWKPGILNTCNQGEIKQ